MSRWEFAETAMWRVANEEGCRLQIEHEPRDHRYQVRVEFDDATSHWVSENALVDAVDPTALLEVTVRDTAAHHRAYVLGGILDRMTEREVGDLLLERLKDPEQCDRLALALMARVERLR